MFFRKRGEEHASSAESPELAKKIEQISASEKSLRGLADRLAERVEGFVVDVEELETPTFIHRLQQFRKKINELDSDADGVDQLAEDAEFIAEFSALQSTYMADMEQELRHIVNLLTDAVSTLDSENQQYHLSIGGKLDTISQISRLNDLRQLKTELGTEIREFRDIVRLKRNRESSTMEQLSGQVESLRVELEQARDESLRDPLTGVFNRRAIDQHLATLLEPTGFRRKRFSLATVDIDYFKEINDSHGHAVGDRVLLAVTGVLNDSIRAEDVLGRIGGDEFVVVFRGAALRNAERAAQKILQEVSATEYMLDEDEPDYRVTLTISIGVTEVRPDDSVEELMRRADEAMYEAKQQGRNCVVAR